MSRLEPLTLAFIALGCSAPATNSADVADDSADVADDSADVADDSADVAEDSADVADDSADTADTAVPDSADTAVPDSADTAVADTGPGCVDCAHGCCGDHCCALDPSQTVLTDLGGTGDFTTPASLEFDTGADCSGTTALGACEHTRLDDVISLCVCRMGSLTIGGDLVVTGNDGLILIATDSITVTGTIDVSAVGRTSGPGGGWSWAEKAGFRAGGIGGSFGTVGGGAVDLLGTDDLVPLSAGCIGQGTEAEPTNGGGRGGAVQLSAGERITIDGAILANGGGGGGGREGGGGGGSGGAILVEAPRVDITGKLVAHGGGGGGAGGDGGRGSDGADGNALGPAQGGTGLDGSGCPLYGYIVGGDGGNGAFDDGDGAPGEAGQSDSRCLGNESWVGGGGGGGGEGRILIRTVTGCACVGDISPKPVLMDANLR